jgi:hypothetical protein
LCVAFVWARRALNGPKRRFPTRAVGRPPSQNLLERADGLCEDCGQVSKNYGIIEENLRRWCGGCGRAHGAVLLSKYQNQLVERDNSLPTLLHEKRVSRKAKTFESTVYDVPRGTQKAAEMAGRCGETPCDTVC